MKGTSVLSSWCWADAQPRELCKHSAACTAELTPVLLAGFVTSAALNLPPVGAHSSPVGRKKGRNVPLGALGRPRFPYHIAATQGHGAEPLRPGL